MWRSYWQLMRFDKPIGIALLWYPVAWALWLGAAGRPSVSLLMIFFLGTVVMRAAGCVINDIADRNIDKHIKRTEQRPLTSGRLRTHQAIVCLFVLLCMAFGLLCTLPWSCFPWAFLAMAITLLYPYCKRFFATPQLVLGLAFSTAIPMVYAAMEQPMGANGWILLLLNIVWVIAYDTEYAMVDRADDLKIGVQSTAVFFASWDRLVIGGLLMIAQSLWIIIALKNQFSGMFYVFFIAATCNIFYQYYLIMNRNESNCFQAFLQNAVYGMLLWLGLIFQSI